MVIAKGLREGCSLRGIADSDRVDRCLWCLRGMRRNGGGAGISPCGKFDVNASETPGPD